VERIGEAASRLIHETIDGEDHPGSKEPAANKIEQPIADHRAAMELIRAALDDASDLTQGKPPVAVGHRVVHGGAEFYRPTQIDDPVLATVKRLAPLAPLHNPANIAGIEVARAAFPKTPQVAVFDTAFHHTLPPVAYRYALPHETYQQHGVRRYGFHGTSHQFVAKQVAAHLERPLARLNAIVLHLGNGASAAAIENGRSVDTSMGLTPLEGLIMGTRSGDIDPAIVFHLARQAGMELEEIDRLLNRESGLRGICGDNDMREVERRAAAGDEQAELAVAMFAYRIKKYLGAYMAVLGRVDAIAFTAGIGENSPTVRARCLAGLEPLGVELDEGRNTAGRGACYEIQADTSGVKVLVVATDEELEIAEQTLACLGI